MTQEALKLALTALEINLTLLEKITPYKGQEDFLSDAIAITQDTTTFIKKALAQTEQEPVAWMDADGNTFPFVWNVGVQQGSKYLDETLTPLYTRPPQRTEQEPVGKFAKFTDGIWREVTDGSSGIPLYKEKNT